MNSSMGFLKPVTSALKKYKALLPSVIITVVAVLLVLVAASKGAGVKKKMANSASTARSIPRSEDVPSKYESQQIRIYMDKLEKEANEIKELAAQSSQRGLITYEYIIFPKPEDQSRQIYVEYGKQYRAAVEGLIRQINALDAPSAAEIRARTGGRPTTAAGYGGRGSRTVPKEDPRVDALCLTRAQEVSVYANPSAFVWYPFWESYEFSETSLEDCWDSQTAFWVYEDIVDTIEKMNGNTGSVLSAPVKRLLGVRFTGPVMAASRSAAYGGRSQSVKVADRPNYITPLSPSLFMAHSPTGRVCNEDVDVIHFAVSVLVDRRFVLPFMKELCSEKPHTFRPGFVPSTQPVEYRHNQITILQSDLKAIDKTDSVHELYRYGKGAVMHLDLICEYQFNRRGYDAIKPEVVKKRLGQLKDAGEQGGTGDGVLGG